MSTLDLYEEQKMPQGNIGADLLRDQVMQHAKEFKTSWVSLGRALYPVYKDKLFFAWGYEKFEYYTQRELGIRKNTATKLLKTYFFLEQEEPEYLQKEFSAEREASQVPNCDAVNVLRLARQKRELTKNDYNTLKKAIFVKGEDAGSVRKDLTSLIKERKVVDPEEERQQRHESSVRKMVAALQNFQRDMESLKMIPVELLQETEQLMTKLKEEID